MATDRVVPWFNRGDRLIVVILCLFLFGAIGFEYTNRTAKAGDASVKAAGKELLNHSININSAEWWEFLALPGLGPKKAVDIVNYRQSNGGFSSVDDLAKVPGIGNKMVEKLRVYLTAEPGEQK